MTQSNDGQIQAANATLENADDTAVNNTLESKEVEKSTTPEDEGKSEEQIREERKRAITEAIKKDKEAKEAKNEVEKIKEQLEHYKSLVDNNSNATKTEKDEIINVIKEYMNESKAQEENNKIQETLEDFLVDNNVQPGSLLFKKMNEEFADYTPKNVTQAKKILKGIYLDNSDSDAVNIQDNSPAMLGHSTMSNQRKKRSTINENMASLMRQSGIDPKSFKEHEKGK